jgi:hypothetical protein
VKLRIKRIAPLSLALTLGAIYFIAGCFGAALGIMGTMMGGAVVATTPFGLHVSGLSGLGAIPIFLLTPFISSIGGYISGYLIAWIYNLLARSTRGLVIETEEAGRYDSLF